MCTQIALEEPVSAMGRSRKRHHSKKAHGADGRGPTADGNPEKREGDRGAVIRAILIFGGLMGLFYGLDYYFELESNKNFHVYLNKIASVTGQILGFFGTDVNVEGNVIWQGEFRVRVARGCDALEPSAAFIAAVLASPVAMRLKIPGVLVGTISILLLNLVRVVSLFLVGIHFRSIFDMMHYDVWQAAFIVLAILFWAVWVQWATRHAIKVEHA